MADSKTLLEHQVAILNLKSRAKRLEYSLKNFYEISKAYQRSLTEESVRGGGRKHEGLRHIEGRDVKKLSEVVAKVSWGGRKATATTFRMADLAVRTLQIKDVSTEDKFHIGRLLLSAFVYAGTYHLEADDDAPDSPLYVVDKDADGWEGTTPDRTSFRPFKKWDKNTDKDGNRLVKPSWPCPPDKEYKYQINPNDNWVKAVHALEKTAFRINKEVLAWAIELDKDVKTRILHKEPPPKDYKIPREELDKRRKQERIDEIGEIRKQDKALRKKDREANDKIKNENRKIRSRNRTAKKKGKPQEELIPYQRSKGYHTTEEQDRIYSAWRNDHNRIEHNRWRVISRRQRFEREIDWATELAKKNKPFYQRVSVDYRGRVYLPDFSYQGSDFCRAVIEFDKSFVLSTQSGIQLMRHTANMQGVNVPHDAKYSHGEQEKGVYADVGFGPDREIKLIKEADSPFCFLRACLEWRDLMCSEWLFYRSILKKGKKELKRFNKESQIHIQGVEKIFDDEDWQDIERVYKQAEKTSVKKSDWEKGALRPTASGKHLVTHLPIAADQKNSAFQHIAYMMGDEGAELLERVTSEEDVYQTLGKQLTEVPKKHRRKISKMILVPWSYGGTEYSCKEKVREWRRDHAGDVKFLDMMNTGELNDFVHRVFDEIAFQFQPCVTYQKRVKKLIDIPKKEHPDNAIEWMTPSNFKVVQRVHKTRKKPLRGKVFKSYEKGIGWLAAKLPLDGIDWRAMKTKAPPNLIQSYDATLVHWMLSGNCYIFDEDDDYNSIVISPLVTVHDSFSSLPIYSNYLLLVLKTHFERIYQLHDPLEDFESDITKVRATKRKRDYKLTLANDPNSEVFS